MKNPSPKNIHEQYNPFVYPVKSKIRLNKEFNKKNIMFLDVLFSRRSSFNEFSIITFQEIEELLYYSNRIQSGYIDDYGYYVTKRIAPSAGARHPVDLLVSLPKSLSKRTLQYYNPLEHTLNELSIDNNKILNFFKEVNQNLPIHNTSIIWFSIQFGKTGSKYNNPESLYWRDVGALLYCIQLVACYLGYKSCPLGSLAANTFYELFNTSELLSGGGILIGK